jgi:hypothetical protein
MAHEMQREYGRLLRDAQSRAAEAPRELQALDARIARLRERQRVGDPDMTSDEFQTVIDRALEERRKLEDQQPAVKEVAKIAATLPNAADLYRKQISLGLRRRPARGSQGARHPPEALRTDRD